MKKLSVFLSACVLFALFAFPAAADDAVVYLDGTGAKAGSYTELSAAVDALPDAGGTVIVCGDAATPTAAATKLAGKPLTITSQNGAVLTIGRALFFSAPVVFTDITIANGAATSLDFIYTQGNNVTVTSSVVCTPSESTGRYISIFAGGTRDSSITADDQKISLSGGTWRNIFLGNYSGTYSGKVSLLIDGATVTGGSLFLSNNNAGDSTADVSITVKSGKISAIREKNGSSTFSGTASVILAGGIIGEVAYPATVTAEQEVLIYIELVQVTLGEGVKAGEDKAIGEEDYISYIRESAPVTDAPVTTAAPVVTDAPVTTAAPVTTSGGTTVSPSTGDVTVVFAIAAMAVVACCAVIVLRRKKAN